MSDNNTGLMWEKKTTTVGSGVNLTDPHDVDNGYTWNVSGPLYPPDGTAFTDFLAKLNTVPCFAGHCDWRLPSEAGQNAPFTGAKELESILIAPDVCVSAPCINPIFGPTGYGYYWSATTYSGYPDDAWMVNFYGGEINTGFKRGGTYVRAVRTGS